MAETYIYGTGPSGPLTVRFHRAAAEGAPVVLALHGGAWRAGAPDRYDAIGPRFAAGGIAFCAMSYTLVDGRPETCFPAQMDDLNAALVWLAGQGDTLGIDTARIGLIGDSAGATLTALYAQGQYLAEGAPQVRAMAGIYGVYDLLAQFEHDLVHRSDDQITQALLGVSALEDRMAYHAASPLSYAVRRAGAPASLIVWGMEDDITDCDTQSCAYLSALKRAGQKARGLPVPGAGHFWIAEDPDMPQGHAAFVLPRLLEFFLTEL